MVTPVLSFTVVSVCMPRETDHDCQSHWSELNCASYNELYSPHVVLHHLCSILRSNSRFVEGKKNFVTTGYNTLLCICSGIHAPSQLSTALLLVIRSLICAFSLVSNNNLLALVISNKIHVQ